MSCYQPNVMTGKVDPDTGAVVYTFDGPGKRYDPTKFPGIDDFIEKGRYQFLIPCGRCIGCRIDYSRTWANRMIMELQDMPKAIFLTLTYNNQNVPRSKSNGRMTLDVRDVQLFFKRLRKHFSDKRIRYYLAGEYGPKNMRPHYHAIVYGIDILDFADLRQIGHNALSQAYFTSKTLENIWANGFILLSPVSHKTCAYVARYTMKKHYGDKTHYERLGIKPEFSVCSRKPGIGMLHVRELLTSGNTRISLDGGDGVYTFGFPKSYYRSVLHMDLSQEELDKVCEIMYNRSKFSETKTLSALTISGKTFEEFLRSEEARFARKIAVLPERSGFD